MRWLADALTPFEGAQAFVIPAARVRCISFVEPVDLNAKQFSRRKLISEQIGFELSATSSRRSLHGKHHVA